MVVFLYNYYLTIDLGLLEEKIKIEEPKSVQDAKRLYKSCLNIS